MEKYFRLRENGTTARREVLCGLTTFLTMMYILFTNSSILSETGMPWHGVFVATALSASVSTILIALFANLPFAMAPGMGINTVFSYTICTSMGYHWKEALAITFLSGALHAAIMSTPLRKALVNAFPEYLRVASGVGLGIFIAYVGFKNAGLLVFSSMSGQYGQVGNSIVISGSSVIPSLYVGVASGQLIALTGLAAMVMLTALEKKTGSQYAALPMGILIATFVGIPLNVTRLSGTSLINISMTKDFGRVFLSFFGRPGLLSVFGSPLMVFRTLLMVCVLTLTSLLDSVGTMIGIGQIHKAKLFDTGDTEKFAQKGAGSKLDKALISNSLGGIISSIFGSSSSTIYLESVTGIVAGGRTGLTGLVAGIMFLLCLPFSGLFNIIPAEAVAPALILAGLSMLTRIRYVDWRDFEQSFPAFMTILVMALAYSILDGIAVGILCHVIIKLTIGKRREAHPVLYAISILYIAVKYCELYLLI